MTLLWLTGTLSVKVTLPWETGSRRICFKSGILILSYRNFSLLPHSKKKEKEKQIQDLSFSGLKYCGNSQVLCFNLLHSEEAWGPGTGRGEQPFPISHWSSCLPTTSSLPNMHVLLAETPSSRMLLQNVLVNQNPLVLPQVLWRLSWRAAFSGTASAQPFDEFNSSCHGVNLASGAGKDCCCSLWLQQLVLMWRRDGGRKINECRKCRGCQLATSETGVNHIDSSDGCILFKARLVWSRCAGDSSQNAPAHKQTSRERNKGRQEDRCPLGKHLLNWQTCRKWLRLLLFLVQRGPELLPRAKIQR